jgi:hypothetical protein
VQFFPETTMAAEAAIVHVADAWVRWKSVSPLRQPGTDGAAHADTETDAHCEIAHCNTDRAADRCTQADTEANIAPGAVVRFHIHLRLLFRGCCAFNIHPHFDLSAVFLSGSSPMNNVFKLPGHAVLRCIKHHFSFANHGIPGNCLAPVMLHCTARVRPPIGGQLIISA